MNVTSDFELLSVTIQVEGRPDMHVRLAPPEDGGAGPPPPPLVLREGSEFRVRLEFAVGSGRDLEGLRFVDERTRQGVTVGHQEILLGDYRRGGPYEIVLPPERLPIGHMARDVYQVTGTFADKDGRLLGCESHSFEITKDWPR
ncbi:hypothetical protein SSP531S_37860 [Streptomyces spongiicola]|uniref:Uncharacterized protein n=1 Tax=Streptomyces spongiicola TaxID=1690221 RepID=A0A2S1Z7I3_9ACTN|nr:hypothetical protein [Streptomyces spongiicola]AWK12243.1 hypothetical protein DDQ41_28750 [Streptomyces spongiicola]GBQ02327.1 hypothetical protein SSP531S_37860 [Streptomyces spongiicola]